MVELTEDECVAGQWNTRECQRKQAKNLVEGYAERDSVERDSRKGVDNQQKHREG